MGIGFSLHIVFITKVILHIHGVPSKRFQIINFLIAFFFTLPFSLYLLNPLMRARLLNSQTTARPHSYHTSAGDEEFE